MAAFKGFVYCGFKELNEKRMKSVTEFQNTLRAIRENSALSRMIEDMQRRDEQIRSILAPIEGLRRLAVFDPAAPFRRDMERITQVVENWNRFSLPEMSTTDRLIDQLRTSSVSEALERYSLQTSSLQRALETMRTPWLDAQNATRSITAFAEMQGIGQLLKSLPSFTENPTATLRLSLGDWRDRITWPPEIFTDLTARTEFYSGLGFDRALTDFPTPAFEASLEIAGLRERPPPLVFAYGSPAPRLEDEDAEESLSRTNTAHDWLQRLESQLRAFIDQKMAETFGKDWPEHRLPNGLYEQWQDKKRKAEQAGRKEEPLIAYADFTDYELVICKRDNWREVFAALFHRRENIRESFQRLYPIRLDTMHARCITHEDQLLLYVETHRLMKIILFG